MWRSRNGRTPRNLVEWRRRYKSALHMLLRLVHGQWPVVATPATGFVNLIWPTFDTLIWPTPWANIFSFPSAGPDSNLRGPAAEGGPGK